MDWEAAEKSLEVDRTVKSVEWAVPGTRAGLDTLNEFCLKRLRKYATQRNDPNVNALSNLSPWLHFGRSPHSLITSNLCIEFCLIFLSVCYHLFNRTSISPEMCAGS